MTRGKEKQTPVKATPAPQQPLGSARTSVAMAGFLLIATVLVSRPLISESYRAVELSFLSDMHVGAGPSASLTAWLDLLLLIGAAAAAFGVKRGAIGIAAVIGFFTLIFAVALSSYAAADKRLALDAGFTLIAFAAVAVTALAQQWRKSLIIALLAGVSASGVTFAVKCFLQVHSEFPELVRQWDAQQAATPTDAPYRADRVNFERRLRAMEPFGYQSHSNVAGSLLAMWGLLAVGAAASRWTRLRCKTHADNSSRAAAQDSADRSQFVAVAAIFALVAGVFAWALVLTGSFGAVISGIFGLVTFATLLILHRKRGVSRRHALTVILAPYLLLIVIGATIGLSRGTLPHPSMAFRWGYWQGAARVYAEEPWRGIGRENFGDRYLHAKNITSPEDVKDPHNFWISMLIELGPLGLVASGLLVIAGLWVALPRNTVNCDESSRTVHGNWTAIALAFATLSLLLATNRQVFSADSMWIVWLTDIGFPWMASYAFFWWILSRTAIRATPDNFVTLGAVAAAVAVLYHNLVSFSLLVPGGLGLFVAMLLIARGERHASSGDDKNSTSAVPENDAFAPRDVAAPRLARGVRMGGMSRLVGVFLGLPVVFGIFVLSPTLRGEAALQSLKNAVNADAGQQNAEALQQQAERAIDADPLSPQLPRDAAQLLYADAVRATDAEAGARLLAVARSLASEAAQRNPNSRQTQVLLASIAFTQSLATESAQLKLAFLRESFAHRKRAAELAPFDARGQLALAEIAAALWTNHADAVAREVGQRALDRAAASDVAREAQDASRLQAGELARVAELHAALRE